jgi:hypothetical protein
MARIFAMARRQRLLIASACMALMLAQVSGVHFHLCIDALSTAGTVPSAVHIEDGGHHDQGVVHEGDDLELSALADALTQPINAALPSFLLLLFTLLPAPAHYRFLRRARTARPFRPPDPQRLRPPLRGPPDTLSFAR